MAELSGNLRQAWQQINLVQRVILLAILLACAGAAALLLGWARTPQMGMLYQGLEAEEASTIVEKIRDAGIQYELTGGGTSINVPVDEIYSLRLTMASSGLPAGGSGGQKGYKILDDAEFGSSPDKLRINYVRAVEGELAKTIQMLDSVISARVHIVVPEGRLFARQGKGASATISLRIKPGWRMSPAKSAAIVHMVAGAVEDLVPENVVVVADGEMISNEEKSPMGTGGSGGGILGIQAREAERRAKLAQDQLTAALGPDHAKVIVTVVVDPTSTSDTTITYSPEGKVPESEEIESSVTPSASADGKGGSKEEKINTKYKVGQTTVTTEKFAGKITSISASVLVDLTPPATPEGEDAAPARKVLTTADVEAMVRAAIVPGDIAEGKATVKVTETTFAGSRASLVDAPESGGGIMDPAFLLEMGRRFSLGILVIGALLALRMFRGPKKKKGAEGTEVEAGAHPQLAGQGVASDHMLPGAGANPDVLRSQITNALQNNPEEVKKLFLHWIESKQGGA
ncbi:MAG: flagellar M-ring protein FliF [bacterium]|nr:flagellar M-ring protein FliF [bacterium]